MIRWSSCVLLAAAMTGCSTPATKPKADIFPVAGVVKWKNAPLTDADISLIPTGDTYGFNGSARTDKEGRFTLIDMHGNKGMVAGDYKVTISRRLLPNGDVVPADDKTPPIESPASESLPPRFSDAQQTELKLTVTTESRTYDFDLK